MLKDKISKEIKRAVAEVSKGEEGFEFKVSEPERSENGDFFTNAAFSLSRKLKKPPQEVAESLALRLRRGRYTLIERSEAKNGFVNIFLKDSVLISTLEEKISFPKREEKINVEFVSANPTGPLTMANGRGGFYGDVLSNILAKVGYDVTREYYINDAGNQVRLLGESIEAAEGKREVKEEYYQGGYIKELMGKSTEEAIQKLLGEIQSSLEKAGIKFDVWFSEEKNLRETKEFDKTLYDFEKRGLLEKRDGAVWFGDRVFVKSNGDPTYLLIDIAYLRNKLIERKFDKAIIILGADHHAEALQVKKGIAALGIEPGRLKILILQLVRLMSKGEEVRMSKRAGAFVTLDELLEQIPIDVARWFFLEKALSTHMDFDLDLAKEKSEKNPVYYVQYAHTRMASILAKSNLEAKLPTAFGHAAERNLIMKVLRYQDLIEEVSKDYQVHRLTTYAYELAQTFSAFYRDVKVVGSEREAELLYLVSKTKETLADLLSLLEISRPEKM
ncbi:arginine--tRNA ligase [Candidatus Giovannonibacteria bacterium]|nr:arginine--tRNA ligase [Candidatus Giovannonibacteria bacterium]